MKKIIWKKEIKTILVLTFIAVLLRLLLYLSFSDLIVFGPDQIESISLAKEFAAGNYFGVLDSYWSPFYPFLIGVFSIFTGSLQTSSLIVAITAGSLAVPAVYLLARRHYRFRIAALAAILAVINPYLLHLSVFDQGTEGIYLLLMVGAVYFGFEALQSERFSHFAGTGMFLGLAYLTRPEAIGYFVVFLSYLLIRKIFKRPDSRIHAFKLLAVLCIGFFLFAGPYLAFIKYDTGTWQISDKVNKNITVGEFHPKEVEAKMAPAGLLSTLKEIRMKRLIENAIYVDRDIGALLPVPNFVFLVAGLFFVPWSKARRKWEFFLVLFCLATVVCYILTVVHLRYFFVILPVLLVWISLGIFNLHSWTLRTLKTNQLHKLSAPLRSRTLFIAISLTLIILFSIPAYQLSPRNDDFAERDAGIWLKKNGTPAAKIFSVSLRPAFYSGGEQVSLEFERPDLLLAEIRNSKVDYVVSNSTTFKKHPYISALEELFSKSADFELIYYDQRENPSCSVKIFRRK